MAATVKSSMPVTTIDGVRDRYDTPNASSVYAKSSVRQSAASVRLRMRTRPAYCSSTYEWTAAATWRSRLRASISVVTGGRPRLVGVGWGWRPGLAWSAFEWQHAG